MNALIQHVSPRQLLVALGCLLSISFLIEGCSGPEPRQRRRLEAARKASLERQPAADGTEEEPADPAETPEAPPAGRGKKAAAPAEEPAEVAGNEETAEEPAASEPASEPAPRRGQPAAGARAPARDRISAEELLDLMGLDDASRKAEAAELVRQARVDRGHLDAQLAKEKLEEAVRLDPQNDEAKRLLAEVQTIVGHSLGTTRQVADEITSERRVMIQQARAEVRNAINNGDRLVDQKDYDGAIREYEKAMQLVRAFPFNLELDSELREAQARHKSATEGKREYDETQRRELAQRMSETKRAEMESSVDLLRNRIGQLRIKAKDAWEHERYAQVEQLTAEILALLPDDTEALSLNRQAREERHLQTQRDIMVTQTENHQRVLIGLDESAVNYAQLFRYPSGREWQRLQPKIVTIEERAAAEESVVERDIRRRLEQLETVGFPDKTPFMDALKQLAQMTGVNFLLTKEAQAAVRDDGIQVQLPQVRETPLRSILNLILASAGDKNFQYTIESGAVVIGPKADLKDKVKLYIEFYDINDVTQAHPDYPAPPLALAELQGKQQQGGLDLGGGAEEEERGAPIEVQKLVELITKELKGEDEEVVGAEPKVQGGKLMIKTTLENHQKVQRLLDQLRKVTGIMVTVESRFLDIQENFLEEIGVDMGNSSNTFLPNSIPDIDGAGTSLDPGYEFTNVEQDFNLRAATLGGLSNPLGSKANPFNISSQGGGAYQLNIFDAEKFQLEAILTGVGKEQSIRKLNSPRVTAFNTQTAHTLVINQAAYIQDLEVNQTGVIPVINPVIGVLNSGSILEVRPTVSYDRKYVVLEIQPTLAVRLQSERALLNLSGQFTVVPVELPVLSVTKIKTTVTIPDGGTVLVGGLKSETRNESAIGVPGIMHIPILNLLFGRRGEANLRSNLFVLINAKITVVQEEEERLFNT